MTDGNQKWRMGDTHYILRMPVHDGVLQIKPLEIAHSSGFHLFRESKVAT